MSKKLSLYGLLFFFIFALTACGDSQPSISAFDKKVPLTSDEELTSIVDEDLGLEIDSEADLSPIANEELEDSTRVYLYDKVLQNSDVSEVALNNAFRFYDQNRDIIRNKNWITIFDIGKHSGTRRMYVINMNTGSVRSIHTTHGKNSDLDHDGWATSFSNTSGSNKSSLGFMLTAETYYGRNGYSMRLDGLESRNSRVRQRAIVVHGADYVNPNWSKMGRSLGCPAVSWSNLEWYINNVKNGSLMYIFNKNYDS